MELRDYVALLRKWLLLIILCTIAAAVLAYVVSINTQPTYEAKATLMVNQASTPSTATGYSDILTSERLARTYASLLTSRPVLEATAARVGLDLESLDRAVKLTVTPVRDTQLLEITAEGTDPDLIAQSANVLSDVFIERNREMQLGRVTQSRESLEAEIEATLGDITRTTAELAGAADDVQKTRLETSLAQYRNTYSNLVASFQQVKLAEAQALNNLVVAENAVSPEIPTGPRTLTNTLLAAVIGMLLAFGVVFLIEYLDDTVKSPDDIERVAGLSTLGAIARLKDAGGTRQLIASMRSKAPETEAYRTLRTNIQFSSVDKPIRSLLVTSSSPGEGKSTTTANLAVVMAQTGQKVIVVDTDLRRPVLHKVFGIPNNTGLTTALLAGDLVALESHVQATEIENLRALTSGPIPPNPSELLGSQRMRSLIESLAEQADLVIYDSPPVLAVTDAAVMGRQVDGVLLVADAGKTREHAMMSAVGELQKTGANLLGVALNRLDTRRGAYQYYYYYYYADEESGKRRRSNRGQGVRLPWQRKPA
jgi:capsular exopolysaccharide synthesis family protein